MDINIKTLLIFIVSGILIGIMALIKYHGKKKKEGFLHPHNPTYPWYWYNFPTRLYSPSLAYPIIYDVRDYPSRYRYNYIYNNNPYYYNYYYPLPLFNYNMKYDIDGNLYKIKKEKVKYTPRPNNN
jgi:hypothetical protein